MDIAGLGYAGADFHSTDPTAEQDDDDEESADGNLDEMDVEAMDEAELERFSMAPNEANRSKHKTRSSRFAFRIRSSTTVRVLFQFSS